MTTQPVETDAHLVGPDERLEVADHRAGRDSGDRQPGVPAVAQAGDQWEVLTTRTTVETVRHVVSAPDPEAAVAAARVEALALGITVEEVLNRDVLYGWDTAQVYALREASDQSVGAVAPGDNEAL